MIKEFRDEYFFLSNFFASPLEFEGIRYLNSEAAFQAQKCKTEEEKRTFSYLNPSEAKRKGRRVGIREDWEEVKDDMMYQVVKAKFEQNDDLLDRLLETGFQELQEGNTWNDRYWGVDLRTGKGLNHLGQILMRIREETRSGK